MSRDGVTRELLKELAAKRAEVKDEIQKRKAVKGDVQDLNSVSWAIKTIMNTITGYHGMPYAYAGSFPIIAQVTAEGRWEISHATDYLERAGFDPIERDTDGIYYTGGGDLSEEVAEMIRDMIPGRYDSEWLKLESKRYDAGIFIDEKNYVLQDGGRLLFRGGGLRGKHLPKACDQALERVVWGVLRGDDINGILHGIGGEIRKLPETAFLMTVSFNKHPGEYGRGTLYSQLARKLQNAGVPCRWGDEISYLKTRSGYTPYGIFKDEVIDYKYYLERVAAVVSRVLSVTHGYSVKTVLWLLQGGTLIG
jgi:DNA polymerase elongation subunit (family B)